MNFTNSRFEREMRKPPCQKTPEQPGAPKGSRCDRCPYWRGIACVSCYRDLLKHDRAGR